MDADSQGSPAVEIVVPSTPPPQPMRSSNTSEMTPPPSTQPPRTNYSIPRPKSAQRSLFFQSPPATVKGGGERIGPTEDDVSRATADELRDMVQDLVNQVNEAYLSAAHFKLQHQLLTLESQESAQRAEIEHQMTRREVEFLQSPDRRRSFQSTTSRIPPSPSQTQVDALLKSSKALEAEKNEDKRRLRKAKRVIEIEMGKSEALREENSMLKQRIQENRKHFNLYLQSSGTTPRVDFNTPQRRIARQLPESERSRVDDRAQDPLAALLAADQALSGEAASLPSTPSKIRISRARPGHSRGAYSLSSLQTTPGQLTAEEVPRKHNEKNRRDRDSTISVSDEEALTDDELPQSQASSLAASMLRRVTGSQESSGHSAKAEKSSKALQTKLFGQVKKSSGATSKKRHASFGEGEKVKKAKLSEGVGLGIGTWSRSAVR